MRQSDFNLKRNTNLSKKDKKRKCRNETNLNNSYCKRV